MVSVITPTHRLDWLRRAYESLLRQTHPHWEWVLVVNGGLTTDAVSAHLFGQDMPDARVRFTTVVSDKVGALKRTGCFLAEGQFLLELDHDDELMPDTLAKVAAAFEADPAAVMVYSDCARIKANGAPDLFNQLLGWEARGSRYGIGNRSPAALPQNVARIWYSPDHARAWRRDAYLAVGGHDQNMDVCDDVDLTCRLFVHGPLCYVDDVLYTYHIHNDNTWLLRNAKIQTDAWNVYRNRIEHMILADAKRRGLPAYDLGGAMAQRAGWLCVDIRQPAAIMADLSQPWPFQDSSVAAFRAYDFVEHVADAVHVMKEAHRCLVPGGMFTIEVPSTEGRGAFQDPTHRSFWNINSSWYYCRPQQAHYLGNDGEPWFHTVLAEDHYPTEWHKKHKILYTRLHLAARKPGYRPFFTDAAEVFRAPSS